MPQIKRAHIHHKDGNPLNNKIENLEVLCSWCHRHVGTASQGNHANYRIEVIFKPDFREQILERGDYKCHMCGALVGSIKHLRCERCHRVVPKKESVKWESGKIWCQNCFNEYVDRI
jgi:5-methylcytosine-specific restriction endonuclease McrA